MRVGLAFAALTLVAAACAEPVAEPQPASTVPAATTTTGPVTSGSNAAASTSTTIEPAGEPRPRLGETLDGFDEPVDLAVRPGDDGLYVVERAGRVVVRHDDGRLTTVLDVSDQTVAEGEQGLLGLAFSSDGDEAYVNYTDRDGDTVIAAYPVASDGAFTESQRRTVLTIDQPYRNHNGGDLAIGPDGFLYIGMGDGGSADDPDRVALELSELLGKILRIDPAGDQPYAVPADNPFLDRDDARPEIWALGLRNPWRFSFDPATGDLWIADVGQGDREEVDLLRADRDGEDAGRGVSLGWSAFEGDERFNDDQPDAGHLGPVLVYGHDDGRCSVSGGSVYRGDAIAGLDGWYLFGDWCSGEVWAVDPTVLSTDDPLDLDDVDADDDRDGLVLVGSLPGVVNVAVGPDGELWALSLEGGVHPIVG